MIESRIRVAGVSFRNADGVPRQNMIGVLYDDYYTEGRESEVEIALVPEPDNPVDPNAVAIEIVAPECCAGRVGFVPGDEAEFIAGVVAGNRLHSVRLVHMTVREAREGAPDGFVSMKIALKILTADDSPEDGDEVDDGVEVDDEYHLVSDREGREYDEVE